MGDQLPLSLRFLFAAHPGAMGKVLGIVYRAISTHLTHKAGLKRKEGATGAVTLIQRFGSALNLNVPQGTIDRILVPLRGKEPETSTQPHLAEYRSAWIPACSDPGRTGKDIQGAPRHRYK
jgi:hypothetical protein